MIHGNSNDPVLIKRISLKIWSLRDEVEAVVNSLLRQNPEIEKLSPEQLQKIKNEYSYRGPIDQRPNLQLVQGGGEPVSKAADEDEEDLEAAMAAAMGGGDEEESAEASAEEDDEEDLEAAMAAAMGGGDESSSEEPNKDSALKAVANPSGPLKVIQRSSENISANKITRGVTILSEVSMDSLYFFGGEKFLEGQSIVIEFQVPKRFVVNADVVYCRPFNIRSRIISEKKVSYRIVARFSFLKDGERTLLRQFIKSIEPDVQEVVVAAAAPEVKEDGGDFDGLEGLDF